jgi:hypothetical protein
VGAQRDAMPVPPALIVRLVAVTARKSSSFYITHGWQAFLWSSVID